MSSIESELLTGASLASPLASRRRFAREATGVPLELPGAQIDLLLRWLKPNQARRKWSTLLADAGSKNLETAMKLADVGQGRRDLGVELRQVHSREVERLQLRDGEAAAVRA